MNLEESDYYEVLGLDRRASVSEIDSAYQRMRALYAPGGEQEDADALAYIRHAYDVLRNPQRRALLDSLLTEIEPAFETVFQASAPEIAVLGEPQIVYLLAELRSPVFKGEQSITPMNLSLVIDRSTSMKETRLDRVKRALTILLSSLSPADKLSLVTFSDRAEVVLPLGPIGELSQPQKLIRSIQASGGTEIYQGLATGVNQLRAAFHDGHNSQLVLLTDGRTYGDEAHCLRLAREAADAGITIHAFGIGTDWDDRFLDALVEPSGGLVEYIDSPERIITGLQKRLQNLGGTYARHITLGTDWPHSVELFDALRLAPYAQTPSLRDGRLSLGDMEGGHPLSFVLTFMVKPQPVETRIRIPIHLRAELPANGIHESRQQVEITVLHEPPPFAPPDEVVRAVRLMTLYRLGERAMREAELGKPDLAAKRMQRLATRLLESGEVVLAQQAEREAQQLKNTHEQSSQGRKQLKYGTRALTRKTIQLGRDDSM